MSLRVVRLGRVVIGKHQLFECSAKVELRLPKAIEGSMNFRQTGFVTFDVCSN